MDMDFGLTLGSYPSADTHGFIRIPVQVWKILVLCEFLGRDFE